MAINDHSVVHYNLTYDVFLKKTTEIADIYCLKVL